MYQEMMRCKKINPSESVVTIPHPKTVILTVNFASIWGQLEERWNRIQVGRQGAYSIERAESLDHYCKTTSRTRAILVCILTPLPALLLSVLQECLPLCSPSEGWKANWMSWIRMTLMGFPINYTVMAQLIMFVPGLNATYKRIFLASLSTTAVVIGIPLIAATTIGFPVPFIVQLGGASTTMIFPLLIWVVFGQHPYLQRFYQVTIAYVTVIVVYPLYKVFYDLLPVAYQSCAIFALVMWKFGAKHFIMRAARELEDLIPESVAFSAGFVSSLFVSVCISTSGSWYLTAAFIGVDILQTLLEFREVRANAKVVVKKLRERQHSSEYLNLNNKHSTSAQSGELLAVILAIVRNPSSFSIRSIESARLKACLPHPITSDQAKVLQELENSGVYRSQGSIISVAQSSRQTVRVACAPIEPNLNGNTNSEADKLGQENKSKQFVVQSLQLLFHCEYLALVEYIECIVPFIFVTYKSVLEQLPNILYFPGGAGNWTIHAALNVLLTAALEIASFVLLHLFLQRKFSFSPLHQLAFVLETHMIAVQSKLFLTILILLQYQLEHLGTDFTFRFEWLH